MNVTYLSPRELKRGDQVAIKASPSGSQGVAYTLLLDANERGHTVSAKVVWESDGGHDIRSWDMNEVGDERCVPVLARGTLD